MNKHTFPDALRSGFLSGSILNPSGASTSGLKEKSISSPVYKQLD